MKRGIVSLLTAIFFLSGSAFATGTTTTKSEAKKKTTAMKALTKKATKSGDEKAKKEGALKGDPAATSTPTPTPTPEDAGVEEE